MDQLVSSPRTSQDPIYILERSDPSDHTPPRSLDRLSTLLTTTQAIAHKGRGSAQAEADAWSEGLDDTPIDGEGDGWVCTPFPQSSECERMGQKFCEYGLWSGLRRVLILVVGILWSTGMCSRGTTFSSDMVGFQLDTLHNWHWRPVLSL